MNHRGFARTAYLSALGAIGVGVIALSASGIESQGSNCCARITCDPSGVELEHCIDTCNSGTSCQFDPQDTNSQDPDCEVTAICA